MSQAGQTGAAAAPKVPAMEEAISTPIRRDVAVGMASAVGASLVFSVNDVCFKFLSGGYALHELVMIRAVIGLSVMLGIVLPLNGGWRRVRTRRPLMHLFRATMTICSNMSYYAGLAALPLADGVAIFFVAPLMITALSVPLLGEKVGPRRWAAVCVGLVGVLVMVRPGTSGFDFAALLPIASAFFYAMSNLMARRMGDTESPLTMVFWVQVTFLTVSALMGLNFGGGELAEGMHPSIAFLFHAWIWPPMGDWPLLLAVGLSSSFGGLLIAQAYRSAPAAIIAPFEYASMPVAVIWGFVVFGQLPGLASWIGIALICGAGLYVFWRETVVGRRR